MAEIKLNKKYTPLFKSKKRYFKVDGGRGSGKSFGVTLSLVNLTYEEGHKILFLRYTMTSAHISIIPQFVEVLDAMGVKDDFEINKTDITNIHTGVQILFRGIKAGSGGQTANLKSITGITTVVFDEAEEVPTKRIFKTIDYSVRVKGIQNRVILIQNPTTKKHWLYDEFHKIPREDVEYIHTTYLNNKDNLPDDILKDFERLKRTNRKEFDNVVMGGWLEKAEGVIYDNWVRGEWDESLPYMYGADWGYAGDGDPTALIKVAVDKKRRLLYVEEKLYHKGLSTEQVIHLFKQNVDDKKQVVCDNSELRLINDLRKNGIKAQPAVKKANSILAGIQKIRGYKIVVCGKSPNLVDELNEYCWIDKGDKTLPIDKYNHILDSLRYSLEHLRA